MIKLADRLKELGADPLEVVEIVMELEDEFAVNIPDDIAEDLETVEDLLRFLSRDRKDDAA